MAVFNIPIWSPTKNDLKYSSMAKFRDRCNLKYGLNLTTYHDLHHWSVNPQSAADFWITLFEFLNMGATIQPQKAFAQNQPNMFPSPEFFPGARLNFAGSILNSRDPNATAILELPEGSLEATEITWGMLYARVEAAAGAMKSTGIVQGDRVAALIANTADAIIFCLATLSIGAIWSSISPDFGAKGIMDRLIQVKPKLIFTNTSVVYNGKQRDLMSTVIETAKLMTQDPSLVNIVLISSDKNLAALVPKGICLSGFLERGRGRTLKFEQLPFSQPAFIFYSSGTTGSPKCIVHSAGGVLMQVKKDYVLHIGVLPTDTVFQYTTTSWIMWAFVLTVMSTGAKIVLYSGSPLYPDITFMPKIIANLRVTVFGTSAKYLTDLMDSKAKPRSEVDLSSLRKVSSTGSVLPSDVAKWFYATGFPENVQLISGSGGTDCSCSFVTGTPLLSVHADEIQAKSLGMAVEVFHPKLEERKDNAISSDEPGELVCTQPFPSQPLTFWGPNGQEKYFESYFSMFGPTTWVQGDLIRISKTTKGIQMLGRSDGVLNPSGVRFGSAEIYNVVRFYPEVEDSVCVGQRRPWDKDEAVMLFLKLKPGTPRTTGLTKRLKKRIEQDLSKRHVPKYVFYIDDIPYSGVGKKLEVVVKNIVCGREVKSNVIANPQSLDLYKPYFHVEEIASREHSMSSRL